MSLQSSHQDSSLGDEKAKTEDRPSSSRLDPFGDNADEGGPGDDLSKPRQVHYYSKWHITQDAVYFVNFARAHDTTDYDSGRQAVLP